MMCVGVVIVFLPPLAISFLESTLPFPSFSHKISLPLISYFLFLISYSLLIPILFPTPPSQVLSKNKQSCPLPPFGIPSFALFAGCVFFFLVVFGVCMNLSLSLCLSLFPLSLSLLPLVCCPLSILCLTFLSYFFLSFLSLSSLSFSFFLSSFSLLSFFSLSSSGSFSLLIFGSKIFRIESLPPISSVSEGENEGVQKDHQIWRG